MAESPSVLLERAAARLEDLASAVEGGPWQRHDFAGETILLSKPSATDKTTWRTVIGDGVKPAVLAWVEALQPDVVLPLATWMRNTARYMHYERGAVSSPENGRDFFEGKYGGALEFARRVLGEHTEETP